jgi:hypothetical protein
VDGVLRIHSRQGPEKKGASRIMQGGAPQRHGAC